MDAPWIPLESLNTPVRQQNLNFLQTCEHELFALIQSTPLQEKLWLQRINQFIHCRTSSIPPVWIAGDQDIQEEMNRVKKKIQEAGQTKSIFIIIGSHAGYNVAAVMPLFLANEDLRIVVIEPTVDRILACLSLVDLQQAMASGRMHFIVSPIHEAEMVRQLHSFNLWNCGEVHVFRSSEIQEPINIESLKQLFKDEIVQAQQKRNELKQAIAGIKGNEIKKLLFVNCWHNAPGEVHIKAIEQCLQKRGIETQSVLVNRYRFSYNGLEFRRVLERRILDAIQQFQPDVVLSFAYHAPQFVSHQIFESLGIKWVQVVTNVAHFDEEQYPGEYTFLLEKHLIPVFMQRGYHRIQHLPLAADYTAEQPVQSNHQMPVVFVGNSFGLPQQSIQDLFKLWKEKTQLLLYVKEAEIELGDFDKQRHIYEYMEKNPIPQVETEKEKYDVFRYIYCQATAQRRITVLEKLAPLGLVLFGGDWNGVLPPNSPIRPCLQGVLPVHQEPEIFRYGSIFINQHTIGHVTGPNMRFFNVPGMGAFQISDANCFDVFFQPDEEAVFVRSVDEYVDQVQYYLSHKKEMDAIRMAGYERVKRDWTYHRWIDRLFKMIED